MTNEPKDKLPFSGESIFATMSRMALEHEAINLSQGFPDFECPEKLKELVDHYIKKGFNQYAPMPGVPRLREEIRQKTLRMYGSHYNADSEITVTAGATQALYTAITAITSPGDECIVFDPAYDSYMPAVQLSGGIVKPIKLNSENFSLPWGEIHKTVTERTRFILLNSPQNPGGSVISEDDKKQFEELVNKFPHLTIICDDVYENILFDGKKHYSFTQSEVLKPRSIVISSFGKSYHTTGWKMGYILAPEYYTKLIRKIHQFLVFSVNTPMQHAFADFLKDDEHTRELSPFYQRKRDLFNSLISSSRFKLRPAEGTYFQLLDYSDISEENDRKFAERLTKEYGVAVIPLSPFYGDDHHTGKIRVCFAKRDEVLTAAAEKLCKV
ncbi:MAG: aminotransferase [Ignavibacteriales bacterium]